MRAGAPRWAAVRESAEEAEDPFLASAAPAARLLGAGADRGAWRRLAVAVALFAFGLCGTVAALVALVHHRVAAAAPFAVVGALALPPGGYFVFAAAAAWLRGADAFDALPEV